MKRTIAVILSIALLCLAVCGCGGQSDSSSVDSSADEKGLNEGLEYYNKEDYLSAIYYFESIKFTDPLYEDAQEMLAKSEEAYVTQSLEGAAGLADEKKYVEAIKFIDEARKHVSSSKLVEAKDDYIKKHFEDTKAAADEAYKTDGYEKAIATIEQLLKDFPSEQYFVQAVEDYKKQFYTFLITEISGKATIGKANFSDESIKARDGKNYGTHGTVSTDDTAGMMVEFDIGGKYKTIGGTLLLPSGYDNIKYGASVVIWADNRIIYSKDDISKYFQTETFELDVTGVSKIKIRIKNAGTGEALSKPYLADMYVIG